MKSRSSPETTAQTITGERHRKTRKKPEKLNHKN